MPLPFSSDKGDAGSRQALFAREPATPWRVPAACRDGWRGAVSASLRQAGESYRAGVKMPQAEVGDRRNSIVSRRLHGWLRWIRQGFSTPRRSPATTPSPGWPPSTSGPTRRCSALPTRAASGSSPTGAQTVRELPRKDSIFDLVLAEDGPVVVPDISEHPHFDGCPAAPQALGRGILCQRSRALLRRQDSRRVDHLSREPRRSMSPDELRMLESLADMVSSQLELRRLRKTCNGQAAQVRRRAHAVASAAEAGRPQPTCATPWTSASSCSTTSRRSTSPRARSSALKPSSAGPTPSGD